MLVSESFLAVRVLCFFAWVGRVRVLILSSCLVGVQPSCGIRLRPCAALPTRCGVFHCIVCFLCADMADARKQEFLLFLKAVDDGKPENELRCDEWFQKARAR